MQMRPSRVLRKLRAGKIACSLKLNLADVRAAEIAAMCGIDCVWLDREHVPNDLYAVENQIRAAKTHDVDAIVRVPRGSYSDLIHPLEMDATGIMVPHVMSLDDARRVVWQTRFHPIGRRPLDGGNPDGAYCMVPALDYMRQANSERFVIVQVEDPEVLPDLDQIAQLDGIDVIFFGPADFSQGIGDPCNFNNPKIAETRRLVAETARRHGKFAGTVGSVESLPSLVAMGYQLINLGADVVSLSQAFQQIVQGVAAFESQR